MCDEWDALYTCRVVLSEQWTNMAIAIIYRLLDRLLTFRRRNSPTLKKLCKRGSSNIFPESTLAENFSAKDPLK